MSRSSLRRLARASLAALALLLLLAAPAFAQGAGISQIGNVFEIFWVPVSGNPTHYHVQTVFVGKIENFKPAMWQPVDRGANGQNTDPDVGVPRAREYPNGVVVHDARRPASWPLKMGWTLGAHKGFIKARVAGEVDGSGLALVWDETPWVEVTGVATAPVVVVEPFIPAPVGDGGGGALPPPFGGLNPQ